MLGVMVVDAASTTNISDTAEDHHTASSKPSGRHLLQQPLCLRIYVMSAESQLLL